MQLCIALGFQSTKITSINIPGTKAKEEDWGVSPALQLVFVSVLYSYSGACALQARQPLSAEN